MQKLPCFEMLNWICIDFVGWGHHFVCKRKYHFIIPAKENWNEPLDLDFAELDSHKLYGLVHCNGYGHLKTNSNHGCHFKLYSKDTNSTPKMIHLKSS